MLLVNTRSGSAVTAKLAGEDAVLLLPRYAQEPEDDRHDEEIVDAERLFEDVAGEVFGGGRQPVVDTSVDGVDVRPQPEPVVLIAAVDQDGERQCHPDPRP